MNNTSIKINSRNTCIDSTSNINLTQTKPISLPISPFILFLNFSRFSKIIFENNNLFIFVFLNDNFYSILEDCWGYACALWWLWYWKLTVFFELVVLDHWYWECWGVVRDFWCVFGYLVVLHLFDYVLSCLTYLDSWFASVYESYWWVLTLLYQYLVPILILGHHNPKKQFGCLLQPFLPDLILPGLIPTGTSHFLSIINSSKFSQWDLHPLIKCNFLQLLTRLNWYCIMY